MKNIFGSLSILAAVFLTGCSAQQVALNYAGAEAGGGQETPAADGQGQKIYLVPFEDQRPEKQDIGGLRNGWGVEAQDVVLTNDPGEAVTNAVKQELERAGYLIVLADESDKKTDAPTLAGNVIDIACCEQGFFKFESKVTLNASMVDEGGESTEAVYIGEGSQGALIGGQGISQQAMSKALGDAVQKLVTAVTSETL